MAIAFRSASPSSVGSGTSIVLARPAGLADGDLLVLTVGNPSNRTIATPSGFTLVRSTGASMNVLTYIRPVASAAGEPATYTLPYAPSADMAAILSAYSGVDLTASVVSSGENSPTSTTTTIIAPTVTTTAAGSLVLVLMAVDRNATVAVAAGTTSRAVVQSTGWAVAVRLSDFLQGTAGATPTRTADASVVGRTTGQQVALVPLNLPPNAPAQVSPAAAAVLDSTSAQRLDWTFSDPDAGDSQSKYDLRYRVDDGVSAWTTVTSTTSVTHRDFTAGFWADGDYEWQVRTYDAQGLVGPYSASGFFTIATPPAGPSITDPVNGGTIASENYTVAWSVPDQDAYQLRVVADDGLGAPDEATVRYDTGTVTNTSARSLSVPFPDNGVTEHIQLRVQDGGLWSDWTTVWVNVSFTPPPTPVLLVTPDSNLAAILVQTTHPAPSGSEPPVTVQDIYVVELDAAGAEVEGTSKRIAAGLPPGDDWWYYAPASGLSYGFQVKAHGDNGTSSLSVVTG